MASNELYRRTAGKKIRIKHVCEVGVFSLERSNIIDFIRKDRIRATLVEPGPESIAAIKKMAADYDNIRLYPFAVYDYEGTLELAQKGESTFATALPFSPAVINEDYHVKKEDVFSVACKRFDQLDDGKIDLLSIDTEGCEWYILKYMTSRPQVISLETHGKIYSNPYLSEISGWMKDNDYKLWYVNKSDSVYYKDGAFQISGWEKIQLKFREGYIKYRRARKKMEKSFRSAKKQ